MRSIYIVAIFAIFIISMYILGGVFSEQCMEIDEFRGCWKVVDTYITSEYCPNATVPCLAKPADMQNNAITDVILQACEKAKVQNYGNSELNSRIEEVVKYYFKLTEESEPATQICEQTGMLFMKRRYG